MMKSICLIINSHKFILFNDRKIPEAPMTKDKIIRENARMEKWRKLLLTPSQIESAQTNKCIYKFLFNSSSNIII